MMMSLTLLFWILISAEDIVVVTTNGSQVKRTETISQLKEDISKFYECYKKKYLAIRHKHIKEHQELRRLNDDKYGTGKRQFVFVFFVLLFWRRSIIHSRQKIVYLSVENLNGMYITRNSFVLFNYVQGDLIKRQKKKLVVWNCAWHQETFWIQY